MIISANINKIIIIFSFWVFCSCNSDEGNDNNCFPYTTVNVSINLASAAFQNLNYPGGWAYYNGNLAGTRGLILVNNGGQIKAYDRNAPHICPTSNSTLEVENDIILVCPEDGAEWILTTGEPVAVANRAPVTYFTSRNGTILYVSSN